MTTLAPEVLRRRFLVLTALRWLAPGLLMPVLVLLLLDRGLSLAQVGLVFAAQGAMVLLLELPTGGLADSLGRRPVLVAASGIELVALTLLATAGSWPLLALAFAFQGVYRALDSGPLEAWYVDAARAADPAADIEAGLSQAGAALGVAVAAGALAAGALVALDPLPGDALVGPVVVAIGLRLVHLGALVGLMTETPRRAHRTVGDSVRETPAVIRASIRVARGSVVLLALLAVEVSWGFGMTTFEGLFPPRLAEVVGDADRAGALLGPVIAVAWAAFAAGSAAVPRLTGWLGQARAGAVLRIVQGLTVAGMALIAGPAGVVIAYLATYAVHGAANPVHLAMLHDQVDSEHRTTVSSLNSMVSQSAGAVGGIVLGAVADAASVTTAMVAGAVVLTAAAPLYGFAGRRLGDPREASDPVTADR